MTDILALHRSAGEPLFRKHSRFKKATLILLLLAFQLPVFAQSDFRPGFYITLKNDSVPVLIDYRTAEDASLRCVFKTMDGKKGEFKPEEIKAYGFLNGKRHTAKRLPVEGMRFLEHIVSGKMHLFRYDHSYYIETDSLIFLPRQKTIEHTFSDGRKRSGTVYPFRDLLNAFLAPCKRSANDVSYGEKSLAHAVQDYNKCHQATSITYQPTFPGTKFTFQVFSGVDFSTLKVDGYNSDTFNKSTSPVLGAGVDISFPRFFERTFLSIEGIYTKKTYQGYVEEDNSTASTTTRTDLFIDATFIKIPVSVRYNFFQETVTPYVKLGVVNYIKTTPSLRALSEIESNGVVSTDYVEGNLSSKKQIGMWASVGITKSVYSKWKGFAEFRYEQSNGFMGEGVFEPNSTTTNISLLFGLRF